MRKILRTNRDSDFGRRHDFANIDSYDDFTTALPVANHSYFEPYIERCANGRPDALFGPDQKLLMFALTSGTTAPARRIPVTAEFARLYRQGWNIWGVKALQDHPDGYLRRILQVTSPYDEYHTESGIPCGAISGMLAHNQKSIVQRFYATPFDVAQIKDPAQRYYAIMRFAVAEDVGFISTANPSTTLALARTAEQNAERLIRDIHDGDLDIKTELPGELAQRLLRRLRPRPARAEQLEAILNEHGRLLPRHYWNLAFLANWTGGTLSLYLPRLNEYYGPVAVRDIGLLASEGRMSIPFADNTAGGVLDIDANFYEFVPRDDIDRLDGLDNADILGSDLLTLQACQLQQGQQYYILLTNFAGLYRYNIGDLIGVTGHVGTTPVIEFLSKGAHTSSITGEKLTENQVVDAVRAVADQLAIVMETFIMAPQWDDPPRYRLYFESTVPLDRRDLQRLARRVDQRLILGNIEYESKRDTGRLAGVDARQVPSGFLARRDEQRLCENHGRYEQFKHRFLYNESIDMG